MMDKNEIIERLGEIAKHAVHTIGEEPFIMSLDDGTAVYEAIDMLRSQTETHEEHKTGHWVGAKEYCDHLNDEANRKGRTERYMPSGMVIGVYCDQCWAINTKRGNYCPHCGADMRQNGGAV